MVSAPRGEPFALRLMPSSTHQVAGGVVEGRYSPDMSTCGEISLALGPCGLSIRPMGCAVPSRESSAANCHPQMQMKASSSTALRVK